MQTKTHTYAKLKRQRTRVLQKDCSSDVANRTRLAHAERGGSGEGIAKPEAPDVDYCTQPQAEQFFGLTHALNLRAMLPFGDWRERAQYWLFSPGGCGCYGMPSNLAQFDSLCAYVHTSLSTYQTDRYLHTYILRCTARLSIPFIPTGPSARQSLRVSTFLAHSRKRIAGH